MSDSVCLPHFSIGVGDRFAQQARAQLAACVLAQSAGAAVVPVWNKSNREHNITGSDPAQTRAAADRAVKDLGWKLPYFVDADHIGMTTVDRFLAPCDFFTLDVADWIGKPAPDPAVDEFVARHRELVGEIEIAGIDRPLNLDHEQLAAFARKYLTAITEAGRVYRYVAAAKGAGRFVTEISIDETDAPQTPLELLVILAAVGGETIPIQTIAPKFTGRFNKGVDYQGSLDVFAREYSDDLAVIAHAVKHYGLPANLKLSVHSGSDKFSLYPIIRQATQTSGAGLHLKTAGTTWLEELIGLADSGGEGLALAKEVYAEAFAHRADLSQPYAAVIDIDAARLPAPSAVAAWSPDQYVGALRHDEGSPEYNPSLRQMLHVGFKVAAKMGTRYLDAVNASEKVIAKNVTENLFARHIRPLFVNS